jgi:hypothetical protein
MATPPTAFRPPPSRGPKRRPPVDAKGLFTVGCGPTARSANAPTRHGPAHQTLTRTAGGLRVFDPQGVSRAGWTWTSNAAHPPGHAPARPFHAAGKELHDLVRPPDKNTPCGYPIALPETVGTRREAEPMRGNSPRDVQNKHRTSVFFPKPVTRLHCFL